MAKDFRATQVETTKIILSGGIASSKIGGAIYSASVATNRSGGIPAAMLNDVGTDVFLFVSGTKSNSDFSRSGVTLFGGDVVVSGTMYAERQVIEVDGIVDGDLIVTGNLLVKPDTNSPISADFRNAANASLFRVDTSSNTVVINEESNPFSFRVESNNKENAIKVDGSLDKVLILSGGAAASYNEASGLDVNFYVSGSSSSAKTSIKGASLFGGDLITSGVMYIHGTKDLPGTTVSSAIVLDAGPESAIVWDSSVDSNYPDAMIFETDGDLYVSASDQLILESNTSAIIRANGGFEYTRFAKIGGQKVSAFNLENADIDFKIGNASHDETFWVNSVENTVNVDRKIAESIPGLDINFFVSGSKRSKGTLVKGSSVFGGDVVVSGSAFTGFLTVEEIDPTITFKEAGVEKGVIGINSSDNILIENKTINKHIVMKINDGGVVREAIRVDGGVSEVVVNQGNDSLVDFRVETLNKPHAIFTDGSTNQVLILSGGAGASYNEAAGNDVNFYVSGSAGSKGTSNRGASVFGGDTVISGGLYVNDTIFSANDTDTKIVFSNDQIDFFAGNERLLKLDETADDEVVVGDGGDVNFRVATKGFGYNLYVKSAHNAGAENAVSIRHNSPQEVLHVSGSTRIDSEGRENVLFISGTLGTNTHQVLILSGGAAGSYNEASGNDVSFYVSGSRNSAGTSIKGTSLYGGDLAISGSIRGLTNGFIESGLTVNNAGQGSGADSLIVKGRLTHGALLSVTPLGDRVLIDGGFADNTDVFDVRGNDQGGDVDRLFNVSPLEVVVNQDNTNHVSLRVATNTKTHAFFTNALRDQVLIHSGGSAISYDESTGADVNFYISGSRGSRGSMTRGTSVFGGDHAVSGSSFTLAGVHRNIGTKNSNFNVAPNDHFLFIDSSAGHVTASLQSAAIAGKGRELVFKDSAGYAGEANNRIVIKPVVGDKLEGVADETKIEVLSGSISIISDGVGQYFIVGVRD